MPCYQPTNFPPGFTTTGRTSYKTEAECNQACQEGACCEGTTCTVTPQCQCQGTGKTFKGVGTVCAAATCCKTCQTSCTSPMCMPRYVVASFSATTQEYVAFIFNEMCRVPSVTAGGSITLSGYYNDVYPCGRYSTSFEGSAAASIGGSAVYAQAGPGEDGYVKVRKKVTYGSVTSGVRSLSLSNDWPIVPSSQYIEFYFRFSSSPVVSGGVLQNGASGYCYGGGTSPLMWVQYWTSGEFETTAGSISVTSSYGGGIPLV